MGYYGLDLQRMGGWINLPVVKADSTAEADAFFRLTNGTASSLIEMPSRGVYARASDHSMVLLPGWQGALASFVSGTVSPRLANATARGVFLGDELCCHNSSCIGGSMRPVAKALLELVGPSALLYTNECGEAIAGGHGHPPLGSDIPPELNLFSIDLYEGYGPEGGGAAEAAKARAFAQKYLYPRMHPAQSLMLVPGTFACSNLSYVPLAVSEASVLAKLDAYLVWAKEDGRVAGFNPWHFNNRSKPQHRLPCDMQLGAVAMAGVVDRLQQIGRYVIGRSEARAESE